MKILVGCKSFVAGELRVDYCDCAGHVTNFVTQGADQDLGPGEDLLHIELRAVAQLLRGIEDDCSEPRSRLRLVRGKPDVSQKDVSILPPPSALHFRVKDWRVVQGGWNARQSRKELSDWLSLQLAPFD